METHAPPADVLALRGDPPLGLSLRHAQGRLCEGGGGVAEALFRDGLCLPSGTALSDADLERVAGVVRQVGRS